VVYILYIYLYMYRIYVARYTVEKEVSKDPPYSSQVVKKSLKLFFLHAPSIFRITISKK